MEKVEEGLLGKRHIGRLARSERDLLISPEETRVDVAIHEFAERCPEPPRASRGHAGDDRNSLRNHSVVRQRRLQAHVRGSVEPGRQGKGIGTFPYMGLSERIEAAAQLAQAPCSNP